MDEEKIREGAQNDTLTSENEKGTKIQTTNEEQSSEKPTDDACETKEDLKPAPTESDKTNAPKDSEKPSEERNDNDDDDGEDLPDNFFDDFSNNDFMAGLDIVDDWIDDGDAEVDRGHFADDFCREGSEGRNRSPNKGSKPQQVPASRSRRYSPHRRHDSRSRYDRDYYYRRSRYSREHDRYMRHRDYSRERGRSRDREKRSRDRDLGYKRSRGHEIDRPREERRSRDRHKSGEKNKSKQREVKEGEGDRGGKSSVKASESKEKGMEESSDNRRDPEKTKRDIQRDKVRCAKDFEARVLQEQLKVAETGLVPPGEELDVVLESEKRRQMENEKQLQVEKQQEAAEVQHRRVEDRRRSPKKYSRSRSRGRYSPEPRRRYSPDRRYRKRFNQSRDRSYSPKYRRRSRSVDREEMYRRNNDLRLRIREKRREKYFNDLSPVSDNRSPSFTDLTVISNLSEREVWLRNRERYKQRYGRSCSPISSSSLSNPASPKRKRSRMTSFMEEIERKLREKSDLPPANTYPEVPQPVPPPLQPVDMYRPPMGMPFQPNPPGFPPGMVPSPFPPQPPMMMPQPGMMMHPQVGMPNPMGLPQGLGGPMGMGIMGASPNMLGSPMVMQPAMVPPGPGPEMQHGNLDSSCSRIASNLKTCGPETNKEVFKLFEEQKISLSDYLSVSAKPIDPSSPINVHKKIKVISKCQEVIKVLNENSKFSGRFFPKVVPVVEKTPETNIKWKSPLRKIFPVRFMFTTPAKKTPADESVKTALTKILAMCGVSYLPKVEGNPLQRIAPSSAPVPVPVPAPLIPVINPAPQPKPKPVRVASIGVQTEPLKCQICEIRSARKFEDDATQTVQPETVEEATQVFLEDLNKSCSTFTPRGILKNNSSVQSISHMTPAQLLALQQENGKDSWNSRGDSFQPSPRSMTDRFSNMGGGFSPSSSPFGNSYSMNSGGGFKSGFGGLEKSPFGKSGSDRPFSGEFPNRGLDMSGRNIDIPGRNIDMPGRNLDMPGRNLDMSGRNLDMPGRNLDMSGRNMDMPNRNSDSWNSMMGHRNMDRYTGGMPPERFSPEPGFPDSGGQNYMSRNSSMRGRGGISRGFQGGGNFNAPNRQFFD